MIEYTTSVKTETNCFVIECRGHGIIVDPIKASQVIELVTEMGVEPDYIFLTHEHFDHIEGLEEVRQRYGVPVVACDICSERIQNFKDNLSSIADLVSYFKTGRTPEEKSERFTCSKADITFGEEYEIHWQDYDFAFRRQPGHSPGSTLIYMTETGASRGDGSTKVFTGDYLIKDEEEVLRLKGGSADDFYEFTKPVLDEIPKGTHIYPGHGPDYLL